ncbi:MAG TPA: hypothetical protein VGD10_03680 [Allosphingosinicella sp.]|uniref:hypothetical protein n=1 Tax=Allosphingosinicella sp. TaxID=2823234 RepID=UPI002ED77A58
MNGDDPIKYHSDRAQAELDLALRAGSYEAARAHFSLSSLHLDTARDLTHSRRTSPPTSRDI